MHAYIHTCMHTYIHTYVRTYVHTCIRTYVHTYMHILSFHIPSCFVTHRLSHSTLSHTTVLTSLSFTTSFVFPSFPVPATTFETHYWKKLTCGIIWSFNSSSGGRRRLASLDRSPWPRGTSWWIGVELFQWYYWWCQQGWRPVSGKPWGRRR